MTEVFGSIPFPNYDRPPVIEVVLGVQFGVSAPLSTSDIMSLWETFGREKYPRLQEAPLLEDINVSDDHKLLRIEFVMGQELPRYWFVSNDDQTLVQVQRNRFIYNWRLPPGQGPENYPRYSRVKEGFVENYNRLQAYFKSKGWPPIAPAFSEVVYVNHLAIPDGGLQNLNTIFGDARVIYDDRLFAKPNVTTQLFGFAGPKDLMRSQIQIGTAVNMQTSEKALKCEMAVYGAVQDKTDARLLENFDVGREWIVKAFDKLTTQEMHQKWGKR